MLQKYNYKNQNPNVTNAFHEIHETRKRNLRQFSAFDSEDFHKEFCKLQHTFWTESMMILNYITYWFARLIESTIHQITNLA